MSVPETRILAKETVAVVKFPRYAGRGSTMANDRAHVRIAGVIRQKILDREEGYTPGSRLPTIAQFAAKHSVSPAIMDLAIVILKQEGLIRGVQGHGMYVVGDSKPDEETGTTP